MYLELASALVLRKPVFIYIEWYKYTISCKPFSRCNSLEIPIDSI